MIICLANYKNGWKNEAMFELEFCSICDLKLGFRQQMQKS